MKPVFAIFAEWPIIVQTGWRELRMKVTWKWANCPMGSCDAHYSRAHLETLLRPRFGNELEHRHRSNGCPFRRILGTFDSGRRREYREQQHLLVFLRDHCHYRWVRRLLANYRKRPPGNGVVDNAWRHSLIHHNNR